MKKTYIRNILILAGIYYLSWWVVRPLFMIHDQVTSGMTYGGGLFGYLLMGIISVLPVALVAFGSGILTVYIVEETHLKYWLALLAMFYAVNGFSGFQWPKEPQLSDRAFQVIHSLFPAMACYFGGVVISKYHKQKKKEVT
ncbi:MAG: hypothetical protein M0Z79_05625 [Nitrospiraceae bacterium]|nr:hypothetical protein [Nitrospiraceae bacterium]